MNFDMIFISPFCASNRFWYGFCLLLEAVPWHSVAKVFLQICFSLNKSPSGNFDIKQCHLYLLVWKTTSISQSFCVILSLVESCLIAIIPHLHISIMKHTNEINRHEHKTKQNNYIDKFDKLFSFKYAY